MKIILNRLIQLGVAFIPACLGFTSIMNNTSGFNDTLKMVIKPLLTMDGTYGNPAQIWRALPAGWVETLYVFAIAGETLVGVLAIIGVLLMLRHIFSIDNFNRSKEWVYLACGLGIIVWGLGFFTIGGEWFLAWQNKNLASFQTSAALYVLIMIAVFIYLRACSDVFKK